MATGQQHAQFSVTVNDTVLTADLSAEFQGDFSAIAKPNFDPRVPLSVWDFPVAFTVFVIIVILVALTGAALTVILH